MLECDVVMKGGITSGVVYPMAVVELSKTYRFRNIGGTSAGAVAAALTAAAEYRRQTQPGPLENAGFKRLSLLPKWLGTDDNLRNFFQPTDTTHPLFTFVISLLLAAQSSWPSRVANAIYASIYRVGAIAPLLAGALVLWRIWATNGDTATRILCSIVTLGSAIAASFAIPLGWATLDLFKTIPKNMYGMCSGMPGVGSRGRAPLTPWLADAIDALAGKDYGPLTFGDLWNPGLQATLSEERNINVEMVTTNVTYGRPFTLPFESAHRFYFNRDEMTALFPERIVEWMQRHPRPVTDDDPSERRAALQLRNLFPLPSPRDIPLVVAARMSLSFPVLLSAVPLHAADPIVESSCEAQIDPAMQRCWFSDGGISSNFPIQFFDAPVPVRPTFGINLRSFDRTHVESNAEAANVWMPEFNHDIISNARNGFDDGGPSLPGFLGAIVDTMQNWNDSLQAQVPGFRDRIVHVFLSSREGGLNIDMPPAVLQRLSERGRLAGALLVQRFTSRSPAVPPQTVNWENHRWVRFRTAMATLQSFVVDFSKRYRKAPDPGDASYSQLTRRTSDAPPFSYELRTPQQRIFVSEQSDALAAKGAEWADAAPNDFIDGAPQPEPELQLRPRI